MSPQAKKIKIRMYNVGFGDSFLVTFPTESGRPRRILFDCGSIKKGEGGAIEDVVKRIIEDVKDDDGVARIDVVVATHRHRDHVSGFASPLWQDVEVEEVWLPWTEHPTDPEAKRIRDAQNALAIALHAAFVGIGASPELQDMALNAAVNEAAMETLHSGFAGNARRRFLPLKDRSDHTFTTDVLPNVTIHAMGPSRDEDVISDMDPPQGESYLKLAKSAAAEKEDPRSPFPSDWTLDADEVSRFYASLTEEERTAIQEAGEGMPEDVAAALDSAVNGTSLMLMLRFGQAYLLFPGDAQWGTWRAALDDPEWRELLKKTTFLKVGHHGSHNATPIEYVEKVLPKPAVGKLECAMVSTIKRGSWPIPKKPLMEALAERSDEMVRSDEIADAAGPFFKKKDELYVEASLPA
jgi:beta-lactamase superfamily II metal-dependent hydrolase